MTKRLCSLVLVLILCSSLIVVPASAARSEYAPYAALNYDYSDTVTCGTIRYICQISNSSNFYWAYWPETTFGRYHGPSKECGTACISMALSYIGINCTPAAILNAHDGATHFGDSWGGAEFNSYACNARELETAVSNYVSGNGQYSPPIIHLDNYSADGHFVIIIGYQSPGVYQVLDPGNGSTPVWTITVSGATASYTHPKTKVRITDSIDSIYQYRNPDALIRLDYAADKCTLYPCGGFLVTTEACTPYTQPCTEATSESCGYTSGKLEAYALDSGALLSANALYENTAGEYWYRITLSDGTSAYLDSRSTEMTFSPIAAIEDGGFPETITGTTNLRGTATAGGARLDRLWALVYPENSDTPILTSDVIEVNDTRYPLYNSALDTSLAFGSLVNYGRGSYVLKFYADLTSYYVSRGQLKTDVVTDQLVEFHTFRLVRPTHSEQELPDPFMDVSTSDFYYDAVQWALENGITNGTSADTFSPEAPCQRAQAVTFLWRAAGCPEPESEDCPFIDVYERAYYYDAVLWALENGITTGISATEFGPEVVCSRAQVVTFLYRAMGEPAVSIGSCPFSDVASGTWYEVPILWAVKKGITNGLDAHTFGINDICNRGQIVTFLYRAYA